MNIEIIERNYEAGERLKGMIVKKIEKLDKYFDQDAKCKVSLKKENNSMKTEVMLDYHGKLVRAQVISDNFYDNLDRILPKLEGQIRKYRTMFDKQQKNKAFKDSVLFEPAEETHNAQVVKTKRFPVYPMSNADAAEEMELLGHSFFIFLDDKTNAVKVMYQRSDGELGVIEPIVE